jgi:hypothetical protein
VTYSLPKTGLLELGQALELPVELALALELYVELGLAVVGGCWIEGRCSYVQQWQMRKISATAKRNMRCTLHDLQTDSTCPYITIQQEKERDKRRKKALAMPHY